MRRGAGQGKGAGTDVEGGDPVRQIDDGRPGSRRGQHGMDHSDELIPRAVVGEKENWARQGRWPRVLRRQSRSVPLGSAGPIEVVTSLTVMKRICSVFRSSVVLTVPPKKDGRPIPAPGKVGRSPLLLPTAVASGTVPWRRR